MERPQSGTVQPATPSGVPGAGDAALPGAPPPGESGLTARSVALGLGLAIVMGAANVYLGLKAGLTVSASIPAAVVGMLALRSLGRAQPREANQVQTAASAGESLAAGIIFTVPALLLIGYWPSFDFWTTTGIALAGGLLGVLLMIPMRRVFVEQSPELPFPEGLACAAVLRAGEGEAGQASAIVRGGLLGAGFKLCISYLGALRGTLETAWALGADRVIFAGTDVSPALVAVGFIVRLNVAVLLFLGGAIGWLICIPLLPELLALVGSAAPASEAEGVELAYSLWSTQVRYIGVGAMAVGGIAALWRVRGGLVRAIAELREQLRAHGDADPRTASGRDLPPAVILATGALAIALIAGLYLRFTGDPGIAALTTATMLVLSFFFVAVASYIVGLVGNSNSPVSGMTITAVLATGLLLYGFGYAGSEGMVAMLSVAAVVCCAACTSGDVCNDLKTGQLIGVPPRSQQWMQLMGVGVAAFVMAPVLQLLQDAYTIGSRELSAPQAALFASLAQGFFGDRALPWGMVSLGVALGLGVLAVDAVLERRGTAFRAHLMPLAVGIYLPFGLSVPILVGGLLAHAVERSGAARNAEAQQRRGVLLASGIIAGESLMGVAIAGAIAAGASSLNPEFAGKGWLTGFVCLAALAAFRASMRPPNPERTS